MRSLAAALLSCLVAIGPTGGLQAQTIASLPGPTTRSAKTGHTRPTAAAEDFCRRYPGECTVDQSEPAILTLTHEIWSKLIRINRAVNDRIKPMTDLEHWGVKDHWDFAEDGYGDCEDYQLLKRRLLVEAGVPRRPLRMTVVLEGEMNGHAVLMVRTDRGDLILDDQRQAILNWRDTGYVFVKREGAIDHRWVSLDTIASPVATASSDEE
jgi:predicted transglutaminase-like cysteine proteinase